MQRRRSAQVMLGVTASVALALTGCSTGVVESSSGVAPDAASSGVEVTPDTTTTTGTGTGGTTGAVIDEGATDEATAADGDADDTTATDAATDGATDATGLQVDPDFAAVCVDQETQQRVEDDQCSTVDPQSQVQPTVVHHGSVVPGLVAWYFLSRGSLLPRVGARATAGSFAPPAAPYVTGGQPRTGGYTTPNRAGTTYRPSGSGSGSQARTGTGTRSRGSGTSGGVTRGGFGGSHAKAGS